VGGGRGGLGGVWGGGGDWGLQTAYFEKEVVEIKKSKSKKESEGIFVLTEKRRKGETHEKGGKQKKIAVTIPRKRRVASDHEI